MLPEGSVTHEINLLKAGDPIAARWLWQRYFQRLVRLARRKLNTKTRRVADEEDVALTAFAGFCRQAERGRLPQLRDREDLWRLLVTLTIRLAIDQTRREGRQKRGGKATEDVPAVDAIEIFDPQADPAFVAEVAEECDRLLGSLDDKTLRSIAVWKFEGYTNDEIAAKLGVVLRTVERKLHAIRERLSGHGEPGLSTPSGNG